MLPSNKTLYVRSSSLIGMDRFFEDHGLDGAEELIEVGFEIGVFAQVCQMFACLPVVDRTERRCEYRPE